MGKFMVGKFMVGGFIMGGFMAEANDRRLGRRPGRRRDRIRTVPPGLLLVGAGSAPAGNGELTAVELIALARAARQESGERAEQG